MARPTKEIQYLSSTPGSKTGIVFTSYKDGGKTKRKSVSWHYARRTEKEALAILRKFINDTHNDKCSLDPRVTEEIKEMTETRKEIKDTEADPLGSSAATGYACSCFPEHCADCGGLMHGPLSSGDNPTGPDHYACDNCPCTIEA